MLNAIYCEFLKLKKSYFYLVLSAIICFFPAFLTLGWFGQGVSVSWNKFIFQVEQMDTMFIGVAMYVLISAYIYTREFTYGTANTLFSYPVSRFKIFASKFIVILFFMICATFLQLLLTVLGGLLLPHQELARQIIMGHLKINLYVLIAQIAILPVAILISLLSRNVIMPIIYAGLVITANIVGMGLRLDTVGKYLPTMFPTSILFNSFTEGKSGMVMTDSVFMLSNKSITIAALTFIIGLLLCVIYYSKTDIN